MKVNCKNYEQVEAIALSNGFTTRELTSGNNGYPENLRLCVTGFSTYEDAKDFADEYEGKVTSIRRRDGWQFSESEGIAYSPYNIYGQLIYDHQDDDIEILHNRKECLRTYLANMKELFKEQMEDVDNFDKLRILVEAMGSVCDIADDVCQLEDDEILFIINGRREKMKYYDTHYRYDVWTYDIAVEFPK